MDACPSGAREIDRERRIVRIIEALCQGCGACAPSCPVGAMDMLNFGDEQILAMLKSAVTRGEMRV